MTFTNLPPRVRALVAVLAAVTAVGATLWAVSVVDTEIKSRRPGSVPTAEPAVAVPADPALMFGAP